MKHHYIPQFYLRPWLGLDHKLQEFRRGHRGKLQAGRYGTFSTGYENDLYLVPGVTEDTKQNIEKFFMSLVDNDAVRARNFMLEGRIPRDAQLRNSWARFILSLVFRNPEEIRKFKADWQTKMMTPTPELQLKYEMYRTEDDPDTLEGWMARQDPSHAEREAVLTLTRLIEHQNVLYLLRTMHWVVIDTSSVSRPLMTSDRPVVMTNGFLRYDGHYAIPISPTKLFIAFTSTAYAEKVAAMPRGRLVREMNEAVVGQARKYVYALNKTPYADVKRQMGKREAPSFVRS